MNFPDFFEQHERDLAARAWDALADGPMSLTDLVDLCRRDGLFASLVPDAFASEYEALDDILMYTPGIWTASGDTAARLDVLLNGIVMTHVMTDGEIGTGTVGIEPDLDTLDGDVDDLHKPMILPDGGEVRTVYPLLTETDDRPSFVGPTGWLDGFSSGDLVAFERHSSSRLALERIDHTGHGDDERAALAAAYQAESVAHGDGVDAMPFMIDLLIQNPGLFHRPVPPLTELLDAVGLESRRGFFGPKGGDWTTQGVEAVFVRASALARESGLEGCCVAAFDVVAGAWRESGFLYRPISDPEAVIAALAHGETVRRFASWAYLTWGDFHRLTSFVDELIDRTGRRAAPALSVLGQMRMWSSDPLGAEEAADHALRLDPDEPDATWILARLASARGDGKQALRLFRRNDPDGADVEFLSALFEPYPHARRNDPCPCGSGRKFKACCAVHPRINGSQRTRWLSRKLYVSLDTPANLEIVDDLARIAAEVDERSDERDVERFGNDPFIVDIAAFEALIDDFIENWGPLLPDDERDTIELWALADRRLWEVAGDPHDFLVPLRDTATGETIEAYDVAGSETMRPGLLLLARVAPAFGADRLIGEPLSIDIRHRESLLALLDDAPTAEDFAAWYGWAAAPPRMSTTEGQAMVACTARLDPGSPGWGNLESALDELYRRDDDAEWTSSFTNDIGESVQRARLFREGDLLVVETLSEERMDAVLSALPVMDIVEDRRIPISSPRDLEALRDPDAPPPEPLEMTPEIEAFAREHMRKMEDRWLDENIPALSGLTPREAAVDPTRREDLVALLNSFDDVPDAGLGTFDTDRLRRKLGLD